MIEDISMEKKNISLRYFPSFILSKSGVHVLENKKGNTEVTKIESKKEKM